MPLQRGLIGNQSQIHLTALSSSHRHRNSPENSTFRIENLNRFFPSFLSLSLSLLIRVLWRDVDGWLQKAVETTHLNAYVGFADNFDRHTRLLRVNVAVTFSTPPATATHRKHVDFEMWMFCPFRPAVIDFYTIRAEKPSTPVCCYLSLRSWKLPLVLGSYYLRLTVMSPWILRNKQLRRGSHARIEYRNLKVSMLVEYNTLFLVCFFSVRVISSRANNIFTTLSRHIYHERFYNDGREATRHRRKIARCALHKLSNNIIGRDNGRGTRHRRAIDRRLGRPLVILGFDGVLFGFRIRFVFTRTRVVIIAIAGEIPKADSRKRLWRATDSYFKQHFVLHTYVHGKRLTLATFIHSKCKYCGIDIIKHKNRNLSTSHCTSCVVPNTNAGTDGGEIRFRPRKH